MAVNALVDSFLTQSEKSVELKGLTVNQTDSALRVLLPIYGYWQLLSAIVTICMIKDRASFQ